MDHQNFYFFNNVMLKQVALSHGKGNKCSPDLMGLAKCCQLPSDLSSTKFFNVEECKSLEPTGEGKEIYKAKACHTECVFKSKGILNESGEVDRAKFVEWTETVLKDYPEFMESAKSVIDKCFDYGELNEQLGIFNEIGNKIFSLEAKEWKA